MISPDITISNHRLRWAVDGMRFTAPLLKFSGKHCINSSIKSSQELNDSQQANHMQVRSFTSCQFSCTLDHSEKRRCCRCCKLPVTGGLICWKNWSHTAASCSTKRHRQGENRKMASRSLHLDELLIQKCTFRDRFNVSSFSLERLSPKGSYHLDETGMGYTLAQK